MIVGGWVEKKKNRTGDDFQLAYAVLFLLFCICVFWWAMEVANYVKI